MKAKLRKEENGRGWGEGREHLQRQDRLLKIFKARNEKFPLSVTYVKIMNKIITFYLMTI